MVIAHVTDAIETIAATIMFHRLRNGIGSLLQTSKPTARSCGPGYLGRVAGRELAPANPCDERHEIELTFRG